MDSEIRRRLEEITRDGHEDQMLDAHEAGALMGFKPATITKWGRAGKLPRVVVGRNVRFRMSDVRQFIREHLEL